LKGSIQEDLHQTILRLHFEAGNMRLWKEKDAAEAEASKHALAADGEASKRALAQQLVSEINDREISIASLKTQQSRLRMQLETLEEQLRREQLRSGALASELRAILDSFFWRCTAPLRAVFRWSPQTLDENAPHTKNASDLGRETASFATFDGDYSIASSWPANMWSVEKALATTEEAVQAKSARSGETASSFLTSGKDAWNEEGKKRLEDFLASGRKLYFRAASPLVSLIVVSYNNPHLLLLTLEAVASNADVAREVIIVDNSSDSTTQRLLGQIHGAKILFKNTNIGFPAACNEGAALAGSDYLCFLNNDALLDPYSLSHGLDNFSRDPSVGVVGGKILSPSGLLQEAGAILWCDGTTNGYGAGNNPDHVDYNSRRPIDYCSGAFMLTPRDLFRSLGGFDPVFTPGYYEDVDYCTRVWSKGRKVIYEPFAIVRHYQNASSIDKGKALSAVIRNHEIFYHRWQEYLAPQFEAKGENLRSAAICKKGVSHRIVAIVNELPPEAEMSRRKERQALERLTRSTLRGFVSCAAIKVAPTVNDYSEFLRDVQLIDATANTLSVLAELLRYADFIWMSEEENLELISVALSKAGRSTIPVELESPAGIKILRVSAYPNHRRNTN